MNKRVLRLAVPNIISNISIPLLGMIDMALLGHLPGEEYLGAVALGTMIFNLLYWGFGFLRMGTSGFAAQALGRRDFTETLHIVARGLLVALSGALLLIILQLPIRQLSFYLLNASKQVEALAASYFNIRIYAAPATIGLYVFTGWFIGMQNARSPMVVTILVNILNMAFNVLFIYVLDFTSDGVAWGTLIAQYTGLFVAIGMFIRYYRRLFRYWTRQGLLKLQAFKHFFMVNRDIFIRTLCLIAVFTFFTSKSAATNDRILAVNSLLLQYFMFFSYLIDGFAFAAEALVGKAYGAGNLPMLKRSVRIIFTWGLALGAGFSVLYLLLGEPILHLLTSQEDLLNLGRKYLWWVAFIPLISFSSFVWDGIYIGATASVSMRNTMLLATVGIYFPLYFALRNALGNDALWLAFVLFLASRGIFQTLFARRAIWHPIQNRLKS